MGPLTCDDSIPDDHGHPFPLRMYAGQPAMLKLPSIGIVPMTLPKPRGLYAWEALDRSGKTPHVSARWIIPDF